MTNSVPSKFLSSDVATDSEVEMIVQETVEQTVNNTIQQTIINESMMKMLHGTITFAREYDQDEVLDLVSIPANARIIELILRPKAPSYTWYYQDPTNGPMMVQGEFHVGTPAVPDAFSNDDQAGNPCQIASMGGQQTYLNWYKEEEETTIQFKFIDYHNFSNGPTVHLAGNTLEYWVRYIQE